MDSTSAEVNKNESTNKKAKRDRTDAGNSARRIAGAFASEEALHNEKGGTMTNNAAMDAEALQQSTPASTARRKKRRSEGADELAKDSAASARQKKARAAPKDVKAASKQRYEEMEGEPEKHQTPQKQAANGGTHEAATAAYQGELSDDDEAPEEACERLQDTYGLQPFTPGLWPPNIDSVPSDIPYIAKQFAASKGDHSIAPACAQVSMAAGKAGAAQQRQQEREAAAAKRAAAKARAEKRAAVAAEQKVDRGSCRRFPYPCRM